MIFFFPLVWMFLQIQKPVSTKNVLFVNDMENLGPGVPLPTRGRRGWVDPTLSTVARSFFYFWFFVNAVKIVLFLTQFSSTLILSCVAYILWYQFLIAWLTSIFNQSGTKFMRARTQSYWPRLQVSSMFVISYVYSPCANNDQKDWLALYQISEINSHIHKLTVQIDSLTRCFCSVGLAERLLPICTELNFADVGLNDLLISSYGWAILPTSYDLCTSTRYKHLFFYARYKNISSHFLS